MDVEKKIILQKKAQCKLIGEGELVMDVGKGQSKKVTY